MPIPITLRYVHVHVRSEVFASQLIRVPVSTTKIILQPIVQLRNVKEPIRLIVRRWLAWPPCHG